MTTVVPHSEALRRAVKWISDQLKQEYPEDLTKLLQEATLRFDLNPKEELFLIQFYTKNNP